MPANKPKKLKKVSLDDAVTTTVADLPEGLPQPERGFDEVRLIEGKLVVDGDLHLDHEGSLVVVGALEVKGTIGNYDGDSGPLLIVTGDLKAKNLVAGGSEIHIGGTATIANAVYGFYNHGQITFAGDLLAKGLVCADHSIGVYGRLVAPVAALGGTLANDFVGQDMAKEVFAKGLFSEAGGLDHEACLARIHANKAVFKSTATSSRQRVLEQVHALRTAGEPVIELDLTDKGLREIPPELTELSSLEVLRLRKNSIAELPEALTKLTNLRVLILPEVEELPAFLGELSELEHLDMSYIEARVPDEIGQLRKLKKLVLGMGNEPYPESLGQLSALEDLSFAMYQGYMLETLPDWMFELTALSRLDLSRHTPNGLPAIGNLVNLEWLNLDNALVRMTALPDFSGLPKLETLLFAGGKSLHGQTPPPHAILEAVFTAKYVEELGISRWGDKGRGPLVLPDRFDELPRLRKLDLSFNSLAELPESLYRLEQLEMLNLRYNENLSVETIERLRSTFPKVAFDFGNAKALWTMPGVRELVTKHQEAFQAAEASDNARAAALFAEVCDGYASGIVPSEENRWQAFGGLLVALLKEAYESDADPAESFAKARHWGERALQRMPAKAMIWRFTPLGKAQIEVLRLASFSVARHMLAKGDDLEAADEVIQRGIAEVDGPEHYHLIDTGVDILLALGREQDAFELAHRILRKGKRKELGHVAKSKAYKAWLETA